MKYSEQTIRSLYDTMLSNARQMLSRLPVANGRTPTVTGLSGWVYEQTIRFCIQEELLEFGIDVDIREQTSLVGRAKVDLEFENVAIEIKVSGLYNRGAHQKYQNIEKR